MQRFFGGISGSVRETPNSNETTELPRWLSDIVARFKQSHLTLTIDNLGQLNISESLKGLLIDIIKLADKDKYSSPNPQFLEDIKKLGVKEIQEIRTVVDVVLGSPDKAVIFQNVQTQIVIPQPTVIPNTFSRTFGIPPKFVNFTGREFELGQLKDNLEKSLVITQKIAGTGGIGKSQLAAIFAYQMLERFTQSEEKAGYRSVIWFIANTDEGIDNQGLMTEQILDLGQQLGFDSKQFALKDLLRLIYQRLHNEEGPFLVVFDNAKDFLSIKPYLPPSPVPVIVTTRNNNERDFQQFKTISLTIFSETEALAYIHKVLSVNHANLYREEEAKILARVLGYFPLALTQALAYITTENIPISVYLEEFITQKAQYLKHPVPQDDNFQEEKNPSEGRYKALSREDYDSQKATVWAVIQLSLKKVSRKDAHQILKMCAYLAPEAPIDVTMLSYWATNAAECREAVAALRRYSLLENATFPNHVRIHQLVQEIVRLEDNKIPHSLLMMKIAECIERYYHNEETSKLDDEHIKLLFPHLQTVLTYLEELSGNDKEIKTALGAIQYYLGTISIKLCAAVEPLEQALKTFESIEDDINVALTLVNIGNATQDLKGNAREARTFFIRAWNILQSIPHVDKSEVARCLIGLANADLMLGDLTGAKKMFENALSIQKSIFGPEHPKIATILTNLGMVTRMLGNAEEGKDLLLKSLVMLERTYGKDHSELANTIVTLATALGQGGNIGEAKELLERAITILEHTYSANHPAIAITKANLALCLVDLKRAWKLLEEALPILERAYGQQNPTVALVWMNLGIVALKSKNVEKAKRLLEKALKIFRFLYPHGHPDIAKALLHLGNATHALGNNAGAKAFYEQALPILISSYGPHHSDVARVQATIDNLNKALESESRLKHDLLTRWKTEHPAQAIHQATINGSLSDLLELLKVFPDCANQPDQSSGNGLTPLHVSVMKNKSQQADALLKCIGFTSKKDASGSSALDYALYENHPEILAHFRDALLRKYSKYKIKPTQLPSLVRACAHHGDEAGLKLLIHLQIFVDEPGIKFGQTALHLAVIKRHLECVKLLMAAKADPNKKDGEGRTPLSLSENTPEIRKALIANEQVETSATAQTFH